ncbi:hypothetical protein GCM10009101_23900 [Brevundimonas lenta]
MGLFKPGVEGVEVRPRILRGQHGSRILDVGHDDGRREAQRKRGRKADNPSSRNRHAHPPLPAWGEVLRVKA